MPKTKKAVVPRLRFPEFRDAGSWEVKRLGEICEMQAGNFIAAAQIEPEARDGLYPCYGGNGVRGYTASYTHVGRYPLIGRQGAYCGNVQFAEGRFHATEHAVVAAPRHGLSEIFLYYLLIKAELSRLATGQAQPGLSVALLNGVAIALPILPEQQKIADCLASLDDLIQLEAQKLDALKAHKKGLMQQLFPREGETIPRLRFPEFRNAGPWEVKRLGEVCEILDNMRKPVTSTARRPGPYRYYGASGVIDFIDQYIFDERLLLIGEDGAKWGRFENTAFIVEGKYWVNNHAHVLRPVEVIDVLLENYLNAADISGYITGYAPPKLTLENLKDIRVPVPPVLPEQQKIADCLSSLDELIELQAKRLDALKAHKKGLLQQLFPQEVA